jgi:3-oxoacyl-[acyl-carrier protein] reductase
LEELVLPEQSFRGFAEKVAVVTNGASGIGRAVSLQLALQGAYVIVSYNRHIEEQAYSVQSLREIGTLAQAVDVDITDRHEVERLFDNVKAMYGRLDLLVNCPTANEDDYSEKSHDGYFYSMIDESLKTVLFCCEAAVSLMQKRPSPAIVNVADAKGVSAEGKPLYVAVNSGLIGMTKALARELSSERIRVNCVAIDSSLIEKKRHKEAGPAFVSSLFDDAARAVVYLLSSEAKAVYGQVIVV